MNTKLLMTSSALLMGATGILLTFLPQEFALQIGMEPTKAFVLLMQILGALYFAFAMLNWMAKETLIGGIYGRPVVVGNVTHFTIGALALLKGAFGSPLIVAVMVVAVVYSVFAILFGMVMYGNPLKGKD